MPNTHQEVNASFFAKHKAVVYVAQEKTAEQITALERVLADSSERASLGDSLHTLFPHDGNERYAKLLRNYFPKSVMTQPVAYFVGIGGIGISAIAEHCIEQGYRVIGSDLGGSTLVTKKLEEHGAVIHYDHRRENMPSNIELFIYSTAAPLSNEEIVEAKRRHIAVYSYKEYLGMLSSKHLTVAITGTHGKTTTTALTGLLLQDGGLDPTIVVGSFVPQLGNSNYHAGKGKTLVVEADEYRSDMLLLHPTVAVLTNIDLDHLDFYKDIEDITKHFQQFIELVPPKGVVIVNSDDSHLKKIAPASAITFGFSKDADYQAISISTSNGEQRFTVQYKGATLGEFQLSIPGSFNILNALAGIAVARHFKIPLPTIQKSIAAFKGTWRRFEQVGSYHGASVYSDYGHHPTAIRATLEAVKSFYPERRLILVFQPHSYDRTEKLFKEFLSAFESADQVFLVDIYDVAGRDHVKNISSQKLAEELKHPAAHYIPSLEKLRSQLEKDLRQDDILLIMGAGNIDSFARSLVEL
jgi:UDP-N-acetylmuramate--alanine ligase